MKKRSIYLSIYVLCLLLAAGPLLAGCGSTGNPTPSASASPSPSQSPSPSSSPSASLPNRGTWDGSIYNNASAKFAFTRPDGWITYDDSQLASLVGMSADLLAEGGNGQISTALLQQRVFFDMGAANSATGDNILVQYEHMTLNAMSALITERQYLEISANQLNQLPNMSYTVGEIGTKTLGGTNFTFLEATEATNNLIQGIYCIKTGEYMISLMLTAKSADSMAAMLSNISPFLP